MKPPDREEYIRYRIEKSEALKTLLDDRLASYERNPDNVLDWEAVQKELEQTL